MRNKEGEKEMISGVRRLAVTMLIMATLLVTGTAFAFSLGKYEKIKANGNTVTIQQAKVSDGKAHFFRFEDGGKEIKFFVVKAADGSYKVAFDACDACFAAKKGYEQQADKMNCKNCNMKFAINRLGPNATGGCNPGYLRHSEIGGIIHVAVNDLKSGARYF